MERKGNFLLLTWDGGGNVPPMLGIARQLRLRGHRVRIVGSPSLRARAESTGAEFRPFADELATNVSIAIEDHIQDYFALWAGDRPGHELQLELDREPAEVLLVDCMLLGAMAVAERSGLPTAVLVHFLYAPCIVTAWGQWDWARDPVNAGRASMGLERLDPDGTLLDQIWKRTSLVLVATSSDFDARLDTLAANVRYTGPVRNDEDSHWTWDLPWLPNDPRALICVSLSTSPQNQQDLLQRIIDATSALEARVLITSGEAVDPERLRVPDNAVVRQWVPHPAVLPHAAVMVTHAGHGTTITSLAYGVPLVCIPMGRDQHLVSDRVAALGCGVIASSQAPIEDLRAAISKVLSERTYRDQAQRLSQVIGSMDGELAATVLESLLVVG